MATLELLPKQGQRLKSGITPWSLSPVSSTETMLSSIASRVILRTTALQFARISRPLVSPTPWTRTFMTTSPAMLAAAKKTAPKTTSKTTASSKKKTTKTAKAAAKKTTKTAAAKRTVKAAAKPAGRLVRAKKAVKKPVKKANAKPAVKKLTPEQKAEAKAKAKKKELVQVYKENQPPKRKLTPYTLFYKHYYRTHAAPSGTKPQDKVAVLAKGAGIEWGTLNDAQKQPWVDEAKTINAEREQQYQEYLGSLDATTLRKLNTIRTAKGQTRIHKVNDLKRPLSPYFHFARENWSSVDVSSAAEGGSLAIHKSKALGKQWKALSEREKEPYLRAFQAEKKEYDAAKAARM